MAVPITYYANISVTLAGAAQAQASLQVPAFVNTNSVDTNTIQGPFTSAQDVLDYGFASGSPMHNFASALVSQAKRPATFYSVRESGGGYDAAITAALASNPGFAYGFTMESRADADILDVAAYIQTVRKLFLAQSSAASLLDNGGRAYTATFGGTPTDSPPDYELIFTGFGLGSPVTVGVTRTGGVPADAAALGVAMDAALDTAAAGSLTGVLVASSITNDGAGVVSFELVDGLDAGTVTSNAPAPGTLTVATTDADVGSVLLANSYNRTSLWYHPTDADLLAERVMARCFGNNLTTDGQLSWGYKKLSGVTGTNALTAAQVTALRNVNCNYFAPTVSSQGQASQAFTAPGWVSSGTAGQGQPIRVTTTMDWFHDLLETGFLNMWLQEPDAVFLDKDGIGRADSVIRNGFATGLRANHFIAKVVPEGEEYAGLQTPLLISPKPSEITAADRAAGIYRATAVVYIKPTLEKVVVSIEARE